MTDDNLALVTKRLDAMRGLTANWDGYHANVIDPAVIESVAGFCRELPADTGAPYVVPIGNGTVQLEWHDGPKLLEMEFESPTVIVYLKWHPEAGVCEEGLIPATDIAGAAELLVWFRPPQTIPPHQGDNDDHAAMVRDYRRLLDDEAEWKRIRAEQLGLFTFL